MTMFGPKKIYGEFQSEEGVMEVFNKYFPDVIPLMGKGRILADCIGTGVSLFVIHINNTNLHFHFICAHVVFFKDHVVF